MAAQSLPLSFTLWFTYHFWKSRWKHVWGLLSHYTLTNPLITENSHPLCDVPQSMSISKTQISSSSGESIIQSLGYTAYGLYIQIVCQHSRSVPWQSYRRGAFMNWPIIISICNRLERTVSSWKTIEYQHSSTTTQPTRSFSLDTSSFEASLRKLRKHL